MTTKIQISARRMVAIAMMALGALAARATEEVIWWQVPDDVTVKRFHQEDALASELGADEARIRIVGTEDYLVIPPPDQESFEIPMDGAWFAVLPENPEGLSFMVELGNWESGSWTGIAYSQSYTYAQLQSYIIYGWSGPDATPARGGAWIAEGYAVPEPSSGILFLIGGGLLALRRKRRG